MESLLAKPFSAKVNGYIIRVIHVHDNLHGVAFWAGVEVYRTRSYCGKGGWKNAMLAAMWWAAKQDRRDL